MKEDFITKQLVKIPFLTNIFKKISISLILVLLMALLLLKVDVFVFNNPNHDKQQPFKELADYVKTDLGKDQLIINYYNGRLHYFELKYYGLNVKAYSAQKIPFWNGTALLSQNDILNKISNKDQVIVMASGTPNGISIPGFTQTRIKQFNQLYLIWFSRIEYAFF